MKPVDQALLDFIAIFRRLELPYAVMGGMAVRAYSIPRATWDVDVTIGIERHDLAKFFAAVEEAGYAVPEAYAGGWVDRVSDMPLVKFRTYFEGGGVDVDVFLAEVDFQKELLARRQTVETELGPISVVSPEDLVLLKLVAARPRDLIDVADLFFMHSGFDEPYMRRWADRLGVRDLLEEKLANPQTERP